MNYNFVIPQKLNRPWYDDFKTLVNQIDNILKNEEIERKSNDEIILNAIQNLTLGQEMWIPVDIFNVNRPFSSTTSLTFVPATTSQIKSYTTKNFGIDIPYQTLKIVSCIRAQRFSGTQGGVLYLQIEYTPNEDETPSPIWTFEQREFNTTQYDPNWINCATIFYDTLLPNTLFDKAGEYNFVVYFKSKDGGEVRVANDRILLYFIIKT